MSKVQRMANHAAKAAAGLTNPRQRGAANGVLLPSGYSMTGRLPTPPNNAFTRERLLVESPPLVDVDYAALEQRVLDQLERK